MNYAESPQKSNFVSVVGVSGMCRGYVLVLKTKQNEIRNLVTLVYPH